MKRLAAAVFAALFLSACDKKDDPASQRQSTAAATKAAMRARTSMGPAADGLIAYANGASAASARGGDSGRGLFDGTASAYADPGGAVYAGGGRSWGPRPAVRYTNVSYVPSDLGGDVPPPPPEASKLGGVRDYIARWGGDLRVADEMIRQSAIKGMNPLLVLATGMQESGLRNGRVSSAGALGAMQVMPGTACGMGVCNPQAVRTNVRLNVDLGTSYMKQMWETFVGSDMLSVNPLNPAQAPRVAAAVAAYNAGPGRVMQAGGNVPRIAETQNYVRKVYGYYAQLSRAMTN